MNSKGIASPLNTKVKILWGIIEATLPLYEDVCWKILNDYFMRFCCTCDA